MNETKPHGLAPADADGLPEIGRFKILENNQTASRFDNSMENRNGVHCGPT